MMKTRFPGMGAAILAAACLAPAPAAAQGSTPMPLAKAVVSHEVAARTALYARTPSRAVAERFPTVDGRLIRTDLGRDGGLSYYCVPGGVPIVLENQLIGAIGIGGGNMDEPCAYHALGKVLGIQPPKGQ